MRITFKRHPRETGLAAVGAGPRGWDIKIDGESTGSVYHKKLGDVFSRKYHGFYFVIHSGSTQKLPHFNGCNMVAIETIEEAKAQVKAYIKQHFKEK